MRIARSREVGNPEPVNVLEIVVSAVLLTTFVLALLGIALMLSGPA